MSSRSPVFFPCRTTDAANRVPSSAGTLAGCGEDLWAEQTGGDAGSAKTMRPGDSVLAGGSERWRVSGREEL